MNPAIWKPYCESLEDQAEIQTLASYWEIFTSFHSTRKVKFNNRFLFDVIVLGCICFSVMLGQTYRGQFIINYYKLYHARHIIPMVCPMLNSLCRGYFIWEQLFWYYKTEKVKMMDYLFLLVTAYVVFNDFRLIFSYFTLDKAQRIQNLDEYRTWKQNKRF